MKKKLTDILTSFQLETKLRNSGAGLFHRVSQHDHRSQFQTRFEQLQIDAKIIHQLKNSLEVSEDE